LLLPTSGEARVLGHDVVREAREVRKQIGYVFGGDKGLYERLPGLDNLRYFAELYGVPAREQKRRIIELLELVGLRGREHERVESVAEGTPADLKALVTDGCVVEIETFGVARETVDRLSRAPGVVSVSIEEREQAQLLVVQISDATPPTQALLAELGDVRVGR